MQELRQSTASQEFYLTGFVDDTDFKTAETALSIANTDIKIMKAGATALANKNSGGATHYANGSYYCVMDATDTATAGPGRVEVKIAGALLVWEDFVVLTAEAYDRKYASNATDYTLGIIHRGTAQSATSTTVRLASTATFADSEIIGATIVITGGSTGVGQSRTITGYVSSTDTATVDAFTTIPTDTITYMVIGTPPSNLTTVAATVAKLDTTLELDGSEYRFKTNALEQSPAGTPRYLETGTADSGTTLTMVDSARTEAGTDQWKGDLIVFTSGTLRGQARTISAFNPATDTISWTEPLIGAVSTETYEIYPAATNSPAAIADAVLDEIVGDHSTVGSLGKAIIDNNVKTLQLGFNGAGSLNANITHVINDPVKIGSAKTTNWGGT